MDHSKHTPLNTGEINQDVLKGAPIYGPDDEKIGSVDHVHGMGEAAKIAVDVGGFLGIGSKTVVAPATEMNFMRDQDGNAHAVVRWSKDQMKEMPEHKD